MLAVTPALALAVRRLRWLLLGLVLFGALSAGSAGAAQHLERFYAAGAEHPGAMTRGPDGAVWFVWDGGVGRVARDGRVTLRTTPGLIQWMGISRLPQMERCG